MTNNHEQRLRWLILARLATAKSRPPTPRKLEEDLYRLVQSRLARREWSSACETQLTDLLAKREIDERRRVTDRGHARLREALGVEELPTWAQIWRTLLPALTLDLPAESWQGVNDGGRLRGRLIRESHSLDIAETPTTNQAVDAAVWKMLGFEDAGSLTLGKLRRAVLERELETRLRAKSIDADMAGQWLATAAADATTRHIDAVRRAMVDRWLFGEPASPVETGIPDASPKSPPSEHPAAPLPSTATSTPSAPLSLDRWAHRINTLACATPDGRYGDERLFIAALWRAAQDGEPALNTSLLDFKARLLDANRAGYVRLHRADLVGAMDDALVRDSETRHLNATFHFIEIPARRTP
ncbi:MAG: hypothetical protein K0V04_15730 [Deltaproteobacteria bacterium]|nr:hypothetical protein [Deltaproteobacteria bacterium]